MPDERERTQEERARDDERVVCPSCLSRVDALITCAECGEEGVCEECAHDSRTWERCATCGAWLCGDCAAATRCHACGRVVCNDCTYFVCDVCGVRVCDVCCDEGVLVTAEPGTRLVCPTHAYYCDACDEYHEDSYVCESARDEEDDELAAYETEQEAHVDTCALPAWTYRRTFWDVDAGVEHELAMPKSVTVGVEVETSRHVGWLSDAWVLKRDSSLSGARPGEYASPVVYGSGGLTYLGRVLDRMREKGAAVNASCGIHVHVAPLDGWTEHVGGLVRLLAAWPNVEQLLLATQPNSRVGNSYCEPIAWDMPRVLSVWTKLAPANRTYSSLLRELSPRRHVTLNPQTGYGTVEVRLFASTVVPDKILPAVCFVAWLVDACVKKRLPLDVMMGDVGTFTHQNAFFEAEHTKERFRKLLEHTDMPESTRRAIFDWWYYRAYQQGKRAGLSEESVFAALANGLVLPDFGYVYGNRLRALRMRTWFEHGLEWARDAGDVADAFRKLFSATHALAGTSPLAIAQPMSPLAVEAVASTILKLGLGPRVAQMLRAAVGREPRLRAVQDLVEHAGAWFAQERAGTARHVSRLLYDAGNGASENVYLKYEKRIGAAPGEHADRKLVVADPYGVRRARAFVDAFLQGNPTVDVRLSALLLLRDLWKGFHGHYSPLGAPVNVVELAAHLLPDEEMRALGFAPVSDGAPGGRLRVAL